LTALIAALSHLLLDWTNNYGLRPFFPFNPRWYAGSFVFIAEPVLWALFAVALIDALDAGASPTCGDWRPAQGRFADAAGRSLRLPAWCCCGAGAGWSRRRLGRCLRMSQVDFGALVTRIGS
jgi:hypothetical protein